MQITFTPNGAAHCLYGEDIDLAALGRLECRRASEVEFNAVTQHWQVRLPDSDRVLFASASRQECLDWEQEHLQPL